MKIPIDLEKSIWEILTKLPKDECRTLNEFSKELGIESGRIKHKLHASKKIQRCKISIDAGKERTGYINPRYVR